jgi:hypothetical protein
VLLALATPSERRGSDDISLFDKRGRYCSLQRRACSSVCFGRLLEREDALRLAIGIH